MKRYTEEEKAILLKEVELLGKVSLVARKYAYLKRQHKTG